MLESLTLPGTLALLERLAADFAGNAVHFLETGGFAAQSADVEQLGAADAVAANLLNLVDDFGIEGEDTLHTLAKAHLADGEGALRSSVNGDYETFKGLEAFFIAFFDLDLDANLVARDERG